MKKVLKIAAIAVVAIVILAMLVVLGFKAYDRIKYDSFYDAAEKEFYIPGLNDGFVPQGFCHIEEKDVFLGCGYMSNGKASRVYVIDEDGESYYYVELKKENTDDYTGHTGGIDYYKDRVYITGSDGIDVFSLDDILNESAKTKEAFKLGTINTYGVNPAFCFVNDGELIVGSFHKDGDYDTPKAHHITTPAGDENKAVMLAFQLINSTNIPHYVNPTPVAAYSIPSFVQGACVTDDGKIILSTSWGLSTSKLYVHDLEKVTGATHSASKLGFDFSIPLYIVDSSSLEKTVEAPPMSEEIVFFDDKIWIYNESACNKYFFGKLTSGNHLFTLEYPLNIK